MGSWRVFDIPLPYGQELLVEALRRAVMDMFFEIGLDNLDEISWEWQAGVDYEGVEGPGEVLGGAVR